MIEFFLLLNKYMPSNLMHRIFTVLVFFIVFIPIAQATRITISVNSQEDFDLIQTNLISSIENGGTTITIIIKPGTYTVRENHFSLNNIHVPDLKLSIIGSGAIFLPEGNYYNNGDEYRGFLPTRNSWMSGSEDISIWSPARYAEGEIEVISPESGLCRLKTNNQFPEGITGEDAFILVTKWFRSAAYRIEKIEGRYIFFKASDLDKSSINDGYNINDDYYYYGAYPRYKLFNIETGDNSLLIKDNHVYLPKGLNSIYESSSTRFVTVKDCTVKSLEIKGIIFWGGRLTYEQSSILFENVVANHIGVHSCEFKGIHSNVISIKGTDNFSITNCVFENCYNYGISIDNSSSNAQIDNNRFNQMGKGMQNTFSVVCAGSDYLIKNNVFTNFGYGGIGVGVWYGTEQKKRCNGIVEGNELYYTDEYRKRVDDHCLMDGGAIYLWTKNDGAIIRYNHVHGYTGAGGNRGIFCDDGAYGFEIYGNIITNLTNCDYSIASRRVPSVEQRFRPATGIPKANINNIIRDNIIDGSLLFVGHEDADNGCVKGRNYVIVKDGVVTPQNEIRNIMMTQEDVTISGRFVNERTIAVSRPDYKTIRKSVEWRHLRQFIKGEPW